MSCWYFTSIPHAIVTLPLVSQHLILSECKTIACPFLTLTESCTAVIIMVLSISISQNNLTLTSQLCSWGNSNSKPQGDSPGSSSSNFIVRPRMENQQKAEWLKFHRASLVS